MSIALTKVDLLRLSISSVRFRPRAGYVYIEFEHRYMGPVFAFEIQFYMYCEAENFWATKWEIHPKEEYLIVTDPLRESLSESISRLFGPMIARYMKDESWASAA